LNSKNLRRFVSGFALGVAGFAVAMSLPNLFASGTAISSSAVNANFAAVKAAVDSLEATVAGKQAVVSGTCMGTQAIQTIAANGTVTCGGAPRAWVTVNSDGSVYQQSAGVTWTITKNAIGHYCIQPTPAIIGTYAPLVATLSNSGTPGMITINTGWGDTCNAISNGHSVSTWDKSGVAADSGFTLVYP
jgi:hypothetical protein